MRRSAAATRLGCPAFTLVELLVVVAVTAALVGMLAPALMGARESARTVVCASNARQIQLANDVYADDHLGRYAPGAAKHLENRQRWHGARENSAAAFSAEGGPLTEYLSGAGSSAAVRECPSFALALEGLAASGAGFERSAGGYGYNNAFVGVERAQTAPGVWELRTNAQGLPADDDGAQRARFAQPVRTIGFADAALANDRARGGGGVIEYSFIEPRWWPNWPGARPDPSTHFRHEGDAANVAWLDGHVSAERMALTWSSGVYAAEAGRVGVGWFGEADDNSLFDYD